MTMPFDPRLLMLIRRQGQLPRGGEGAMQVAPPVPGRPPQPPRRNLFDSIFGISSIPEGLLSDEDRKSARNAGMLRAGLALLAGSRGVGPNPGLGAGLLSALEGGQQGAMGSISSMMQMRELQKKQAAEQARQEIFKRFPPQPGESPKQTLGRLQMMLPQLIQAGDPLVPSIVELLKSQGQGERPIALPKDSRLVDPVTGRVMVEGTGGVEPELRDLGDAVAGLDPNTGKVLWRVPKGESPSTGDVRSQRTFNRENQLADDFRANARDYQVIAGQYGAVQSALDGAISRNPASQIALIFAYMKMLDPNSVVRESEYATAANAAGVPERVRNQYNKLLEGAFLTPTQVKNFATEAKSQARRRRQMLKGLMQQYERRAKRWGIEPSAVSYDYFEDFDLGQDSMSVGAARVDSLLNRR